MDIDLTQLEDRIASKLLKLDLRKASKILSLSENEFCVRTGIYGDKMHHIYYLAAECLVKPCPIENELETITTGCPIIDSVLGGGIHAPGGVVELSGESGCGKTQICLQISLTAQHPVKLGGIDKSVLYICTEDSFPSKRLQQLIQHIRPPYIGFDKSLYGDRIFIEHIPDVKALKNNLYTKLPNLLKKGNIGLIIIDSIAAIFRSDYTFQDGIQRTKDIRSIGYQLHLLSKKYQIGVVCVNQVSSQLNENKNVPALGLTWANLVTTRIVLSKESYSNKRKIQLVFSPHCPSKATYYKITEKGMCGLK